MKYRILKRQTNEFGEWWCIQARFLLWWVDVPRVYKTFDEAAFDLLQNHNTIGEHPEETNEVELKL